MVRKGIRVPREHDRVTTQGRNGVFAVVDVDNGSKTVALQTVTGDGPVLQSVPWTSLQYMDQEDVNQAAARIVRKATEDK
jgi:hypothetical protein